MGDLWRGLLELVGRTLAFFYDVIPNFGVAIIFLTLTIGLLLFPLTLKQTRSMKAMQEIQPEIKRLQKELKGDRERLNQEMMALYKERGVNPAGGCLPLILQMPIWFALFRVLQNPLSYVSDSSSLADAINAGRTGFLGLDLTVRPSEAVSDGIVTAIPYLIAILVVVATGYYQQRQTMSRTKSSGKPQSDQQQSMQTVMKVLPVVFGLISWQFPAGLVLYFAVSQLFRIGQQGLILKMDADREHAKPASAEVKKPVEPSTESSPRPRSGAQKAAQKPGSRAQQGSKKKKRKRRS